MNQFRQRLQQLAETDIAVWFYGEHGTGRMTGARYLHQLGRNAKGPFVRYELTPENAGQLETFIDRAQGGTLVLSHPEYLTREQQHHLARLQSTDIGLFVWWALVALRWWSRRQLTRLRPSFTTVSP